jgi:thiol-disulfide isomerase/thioredoxin
MSLLWLFLNPTVAAAVPGEHKAAVINHVAQTEEKVVIYFFWGDGCPHCAQAKPYLEALVQENPSIELRMFEVYNSEENQALFAKVSEVYGFTPRYVPTIFIGDQYWEGWSDMIQAAVTAAVEVV